MPAQYPGIGFPPDGPVQLARKLVNNTALMAAAFASGAVPIIVAAPASSSASGTPGQIAYDASYLYVAIAANTWRRTPIDDWA